MCTAPLPALNGQRSSRLDGYLGLIDDLGYTGKVRDGFLGKLLVVEAAQTTSQEEYTLVIAFARHLLDARIRGGTQTSLSRLNDFAGGQTAAEIILGVRNHCPSF